MSLIKVRGVNPFAGQSDPYITLDTSVSYDDGPQGVITNSYSLQGVLTGCSVNELSNRRDALVNSFDWKNDTGIIENIEIVGVVKASPSAQIIPKNLSFDSSTYIGALPYSISLDIFTGFGGEQDDQDLINKTHTESTSISQDGCVTRNITIGCEPNSNLAHCDALTVANEWISGQLGVTKLGKIEVESVYEVQTESLDINPITSALSYTRTESNCKDGNNTAEAGLTGLHFAYCIESDTNQGACPAQHQEITKTYNGEVYSTGKSITELVGEIKTRLFPSMVGITNFGATYDEAASNITFNAARKTDGNGEPISVPQDLVVNKYTLTETTDYNDGGEGTTFGSVQGSVQLLNPINVSPLSVNSSFDPKSMIAVAKGVCSGPSKLTQQNVSYDDINGGVTYNYGFGLADGPDDGIPNLEGVSGLSSWSIDYKPPLTVYETVPTLNCPDFLLDLGYASRGSIGVTVISNSGNGYDFENVAVTKGQDLVNTMSRNKEDLQVAEDGVLKDGEIATYSYKATFKGKSVVTDGNTVGSLF